MDRTKSKRGVHNERKSDSAVKKKEFKKKVEKSPKTERYREKEKTSKRR